MDNIGDRLWQARESKGITLEVAEEETKIRRKYLECLEAGQYAALPGEVYLKGFLRTYGNYLGLDGGALVDQYKDQSAQRRPRAAAEAAATVPEPSVPASPQAPVREPEPAISHAERRARAAARRNSVGRPRGANGQGAGRSVTTVAVAILAVAVIGYLGWLIASMFKPDTPPAPPPAAQTETPATKQPEPAPPPKLPEQPKVTMTRSGNRALFAVPAAEAVIKVEVPSGNKVWIEARENGKAVFSGTLAKDQEFKGTNLEIQFGHMNGISLVVNNQRFEKPFEGGPYWLTFKAQ